MDLAVRARVRLLVALALAIVLPFGQAAAAGVPGSDPEPVRGPAAELPNVPTEPTAAAATLVAILLGPDADAANSALTEILRRSAIPVVSLDGTIVAEPDGLALIDGIIYAELVPDLASSIRAGDFYPVQNVAWLIADSIGFDGELPASAVLGGFGRWGKEADDPPESKFAGAAARALSAARGDVLYESAPPEDVEIDPLQAILLIEHLLSPAVEHSTGSSRAGLLAFLDAQVVNAAGPCDAIYDKFKKADQVDQLKRSALKDAAKDAFKGGLSEGGRQAFEIATKFTDAADKAGAIASTIILLLNVKIDITDDHGGQTHTRHSAGEVDRHVQFKAHAWMKSGFNQQEVKCLYFLGLDVPPVGDLPNFRVRWSVQQPQTSGRRGQLTRVAPGDGIKTNPGGSGGELTNPKGESTLKLEVAIERPPDQGEELTAHVEVRASLDKDDFPFKLKDLLKLEKLARHAVDAKSPWQVTVDKIFDIVNSAIKRLGLPVQRRLLDVEYHGSDIYLVRGETDVFLFYYTATVFVDVYSCEGIDGPWIGEGGFKNLDGTLFKDAAQKVFGKQFPNQQVVQGVVDHEQLSLGGEPYLTVLRGDQGSRLRLAFDVDFTRVLTSRVRGQTVGTAELLAEYDSLQPFSLSGNPPRFPVRSIDPSQLASNSQNVCPDVEYIF
jgi:hypothetical protein